MKKTKNISYYLILAILTFMPLFSCLGDLSIRQFDEGRLAQSAIEMSKTGNLIVVTYDYKPEMWSTKPPLMIWLQAVCIKIFGVCELAIRLPSALAAFFTCCLLLFVCNKYLNKPWLGIIASLVLVTTNGYIHLHATRTGDYDALLTFFLTAYCMLFFIYSETKSKKHLYLFFLCLTLAVLTKGIAGIMMLPAVCIFSLIYKQTIPLLKNKHFYTGIAIFLFFSLGYYFLREMLNPGYIEAVSLNELGGRFNEANDGHTGDGWYYYDVLVKFFLNAWYLLIPCGLLIGLFYKDKLSLKFSTIVVISFFVFYFVISIAKTKLEWYATPLYPFTSLIVAFFIYSIFNFLQQNNLLKKQLTFNTLPFIFLFLIFINPYTKIVNETYKPKEYDWDTERYEMAYFLKDALKDDGYDLQNYFYLHDDYMPQNDFYLEMLRNKGTNVNIKNYKKLSSGDNVFTDQNTIKDYVKNNYDLTELFNKGKISIFKIKGSKIQG